MSSRKRTGLFAVAAIFIGLLSSCTEGPSASGTKTDWLKACQLSEQCVVGAQCLAGICSSPCSTSDECIAGACSTAEESLLVDDEVMNSHICVPVEQVPFSTPVSLAGLAIAGATSIDDPSFTRDRLELYLGVDGLSEGAQIWRSSRSSSTEPWGAPALVPELNPPGGNSSMPGVSSDGLTIYFTYDPLVSFRQLYFATRSTREAVWSSPEPVPFTNGPEGGDSPSGTGDGLLLVWAREDGNYRSLFHAQRASLSEPFEPLGSIPELTSLEARKYEPWLSDDGLNLFFRMHDDIYQSSRTARDQPFKEPLRLDELSSGSYDGDPWLSPDLRHVMFASEQEGMMTVFEASR